MHRAAVIEDRLEHVDAALRHLEAGLTELSTAREAVGRSEKVLATMAWLVGEQIPESETVSVILPTYQRPEQLRQAIGSVLGQRYTRWELLVVDDGSDTAKSVVAEVGDERVRCIEVEHGGPSVARNAGLDTASGSVIAYLDDDNLLDPGWLAAVVWAFAKHPEREVLYGARLIDDDIRVYGSSSGGWPWLQLNPFDPERLREGNIADMGVLAHRAGLPEARFDERLREYADWDFFLSITQRREPLMLPALAMRYTTEGNDRLTRQDSGEVDLVREKWRSAPD